MLEINNLTKIYPGGHKAVDDVSLTVNAGEIYGFIGPNGAGKTTTIKAVTGIIDFDHGEIAIDGHDIANEPIEAKKITAFLPDNPDLYDQLTGIQYLNFVADMYGVGKKEREKRIREYADAFEITPDLGSLISSYSHGMKQKLALISALIHNPKLLVLDEPFVGLDPKASVTLKRYMHELCRAGSAIFFSTHVLDTAEKLCDKIAIIKNGRIVESGRLEDLTRGESLEDTFMETVENDSSTADKQAR